MKHTQQNSATMREIRRRGYRVSFGDDVSALIKQGIRKARKTDADKKRLVVEILQALAWGLGGERIYVGIGVDEQLAKRDEEIYDRKFKEKIKNTRLAVLYGLSERQIQHIVKNETLRRRQLARQ
jgi:Mor family transcriptional regulator